MALRYKIDVLKELKDKGYNTTVIREKKLFSQSTLTKFRNHQGVDWSNIEQLCRLLNCQPGDILEYGSGDGTDNPSIESKEPME